MHILPVKPYLGPHQDMCSPQDSSPVKIKHDVISRKARISAVIPRLVLVLLLVFSASPRARPQSQTIDSIRVIGNRRIPKETILARMFTHPGDPYDPVSIERDFNSLWNTGYFEDLRIEREDTEKGIILNVFVRSAPPFARSITRATVLSRRPNPRPLQEGEGRPLGGRASTIRPR